MNNKYKIKKNIIIFLIIIIIGAIIINIFSEDKRPTAENPVLSLQENIVKPIDICYFQSTETNNGFYDISWIKLKIEDSKISGEFQNLPAEKDSKIGKFEGTVGPLDQTKMARRAKVIWDSEAERMNNKEELIFEFGDGSAVVMFGEMVNRGDGIYVYKNQDNLYPQKTMSQIDCENLEEKLFVEKYIRDNISNISNNKPILGGNWYVLSTTVNPQANTGRVKYEDGHIESLADFIYNYTKIPQEVVITKFEVKE